MIIQKYILSLLTENNCVIVPGFGAFLKHAQSASIHPISHKITPPQVVIGFNSSLTLNDNLLIKHLALGENMSDEEALQMVEAFTHQLQHQITQFGYYEIQFLGRFFFNPDGLVQFEHEKSENIFNEYFGLRSIRTMPVNRTKYMKSENKNVTAPTANENKIPKRKVGVLLSAVLLLLLIGSFFVMVETKQTSIAGFDLPSIFPSINIFNQEDEKITQTPAVVEQPAVEQSEVPASESLETTPTETLVTETPASSPETKSNKVSQNLKNIYYVVLASFQSKQHANQYVNEIKGNGTQSEVIQAENGMYRVAVKSSNDKDQALELKNTLALNYGSDVWIVKK